MKNLFNTLFGVKQEAAEKPLVFPLLNLPTPKNQTAEILYELLTNKEVTFYSCYSQTGIINLGARISDLRKMYHLDIETSKLDKFNKHGRKTHPGIYKLLDKEQGLLVYKKICKDE